jgi:hypothetical protein
MTEREIKWKPEDLDRCEHGRHSIDSCLMCPDGQSTGNLHLLRLWEDPGSIVESPYVDKHGVRGDRVQIGTMLGGHPIWVQPKGRIEP